MESFRFDRYYSGLRSRPEARNGSSTADIAYKKELTAGDVVVVRSEIVEVREKVIRFQHELINDANGELAAVCELTGVHMDLRTRKSRPLPPEIVARARASLRT